MIVIVVAQGLGEITALLAALSSSPSTSITASMTSTASSAHGTTPAMSTTLRDLLLMRFTWVIEERHPILIYITCRCAVF